MKYQHRKVFINNAGDLFPKNDLREEKLRFRLLRIHYPKEYNKLSYGGIGHGNFNKINEIKGAMKL